MKESQYQAKLIKKIKTKFPGCIVLNNDGNYIQGIPDLIILNNCKWAALEVKDSKDAHHQPNQDYYVNKMNRMSYASFVYPENEQEVLNELSETFQKGRVSRIQMERVQGAGGSSRSIKSKQSKDMEKLRRRKAC